MKNDNRAFLFVAILLVGLLMLSSCGRIGFREALRMAGDNRNEMERVVEHYRAEDKNPKKRKAARYLIRNMAFHRSYSPEIYREYCDSLIAVFSSDMSVEDKEVAAERVKTRYSVRLGQVNDIQTLSAEYLIQNIDISFDMWKNSPFLEHLSFNQMCELVLPYKCFDGQPADNWKEYARLPTGSDLDCMGQIDELRHNPRAAAEIVSGELMRYKDGRVTSNGHSQVYDYELLKVLPYANCADYTNLDIIAERANGVPVSTDFTPGWPFMGPSHYWNTVKGRNRLDVYYQPLECVPGEPYCGDNRHAKVFRRTYTPNHELLRIIRRGEILPDVFSSNLFITDVTREYSTTQNLKVTLNKSAKGHSAAFLAVFYGEWLQPVDYGYVLGRTAFFDNVGFDNMFIVVVTDINGKLIPVTEPFFFDKDGDVTFCKVSDQKEDITLTRNFISLGHIWKARDKIRGGAVDAADCKDFSDCHEVAVFPPKSVFSVETEIDDDKPHRYWRIRASGGDTTSFAEVYFFVDGEIRAPIPLDARGTVAQNAAGKLVDGSLDEFLDIEKGGFASFDFGEKVKVDKVATIKRGDNNGITPGDEYELYVWIDNKWNLLETKRANDIRIVFENVPCGALFFIKDITQGYQNRIFKVEDGEIVWY